MVSFDEWQQSEQAKPTMSEQPILPPLATTLHLAQQEPHEQMNTIPPWLECFHTTLLPSYLNAIGYDHTLQAFQNQAKQQAFMWVRPRVAQYFIEQMELVFPGARSGTIPTTPHREGPQYPNFTTSPGQRRRLCSHPGCTSYGRARGLCKAYVGWLYM